MRRAVALLLLTWGALAQAHPLGNNTVNRATALVVDGDTLRIDYRQDLAEIPTLLATQRADSDGDGEVSATEWQAHADAWSRALVPALEVHDGQQALRLRIERVEWQLVDGAAGLTQLRLQGEFSSAEQRSGGVDLRYEDRSGAEDSGWREVWVEAAHGARIVASRAARHDRSAGLTRFPATDGPWPHDTRAELRAEFSAARSAARPPAGAPTAALPVAHHTGLAALFLLGVHHIATGWDHLMLLLGLVLLCRSTKPLLAVVTAFTVAHSLTLALAAADLVTPPGALVEPAIALSIAYVGLCNVLRRQGAHGVLLAFAFGLVHGFGFAGALAETLGPVAFAGHGWLWSLAAFNLGIESFQLAALALLLPCMAWAAHRSWAALARRGASHTVMWSGLAWFAARVVGI